MTPCRVVVEYQCFGGLRCPEDGGSKVLRNIGILPQHYTASQSRRLRLKLTLMFLNLKQYDHNMQVLLDV